MSNAALLSMTTCSILVRPASCPVYDESLVVRLPAGPKVRRRANPKYRPFRVMKEIDGVLSQIGPSYTNLGRALSQAMKVSDLTPDAVAVLDASLSINRRVIRIFRRGIDILAGADDI